MPRVFAVVAASLFAASATPALEGRAARLAVIRSFNNVCEIEVVRAVLEDDSRRDAYTFRATNAVARGVAREAGLNVYALGADRFIALNG